MQPYLEAPPGSEESQCASLLFSCGNIGECRKLLFLKSRNKKDKESKVSIILYKVFRTSHSCGFASYHLRVEGEVTRVPKDAYKCMRTILETPAAQTRGANGTYGEWRPGPHSRPDALRLRPPSSRRHQAPPVLSGHDAQLPAALPGASGCGRLRASARTVLPGRLFP